MGQKIENDPKVRAPEPTSTNSDLNLANEVLSQLEAKPSVKEEIVVPTELAGKLSALAWERRLAELSGDRPKDAAPMKIEELYRRTGLADFGISLEDYTSIYKELSDRPDKPIVDRARELKFENPEIVSLERVVFETQIRAQVNEYKATIAKYIGDVLSNTAQYQPGESAQYEFKLGPSISAFKEVSRDLSQFLFRETGSPEPESVDSPALQEFLEYLKQLRLPHSLSVESGYSYKDDYQGFRLIIQIDYR